jgi:hypothetical protein
MRQGGFGENPNIVANRKKPPKIAKKLNNMKK